MPYKFEHEHLKIKDKDDRRIKLFDEDREEIRKLYATGLYSQRDLANKYNIKVMLFVYNLFTFDASYFILLYSIY